MKDRRSFFVEAGSALLGAAALSETAKAAPNNELTFFYAEGVVWNPTLPGLAGALRLNVYLAISGDGTGIGTMSDSLHPQVNSHLTILMTVRQGNRYEIRGEISDSNDPTLAGQPFVIPAAAHGDATILNLRLGADVFAGLGRITNIRANASGSDLGSLIVIPFSS